MAMMRSVLRNALRFCLQQQQQHEGFRGFNFVASSRDLESSRTCLKNWFGAAGSSWRQQRNFSVRRLYDHLHRAPIVPARAGRDEIRGLAELAASRSTHAVSRGQAHWTKLPRFMMHGMLWCGNERVSYLLAAVAATGFLGGAGLFVVLADAGQREEQGTSRPPAAASGEVEEVVRSTVGTGPGRKKKVVVLGTGWAGTSFLKNLDSSLYDVSVVAPRNCFVFTPLLPSVASGVVEARSVTEPIRRIIRKRNIEFYQSECVRIDAKSKQILCHDFSERKWQGKDVEFTLDYDLLVVAVGATNNTFGTKGVQEYCHFLKEIEDAEKIRESVVGCFETASLPNFSSEDRSKLLHFVVVGGGPTGVEYAAELHDLIHDDLCRLYPHLEQDVTITVVQSGDHILNSFDRRISEYAEKKFSRDGVDVKIEWRVSEVTDENVCLKSKKTGELVQLPYGMVVWSTGIATRPVVADLMAQIGQADRKVLATDAWLHVHNCEGVYALGDCASVEQRKIAEDITNLFELADKEKSGLLTAEEFLETAEKIRPEYPQIDIYLEHQHMESVIGLLDNAVKDGKQSTVQLDLEHFRKAMCKVDSQLKSMPATAQVAAQQGAYLACCFNKLAQQYATNIKPEDHRHQLDPFSYRHLGQFAPLGGEIAAAEIPGDWVSIGHSTQWLWYSVYASMQVSWRTRVLVMFDWAKKFIFGRDSSSM